MSVTARQWARGLFTVYWFFLVLAAYSVLFTTQDYLAQPERASAITGNPNSLGAAITVSAIFAMFFNRSRRAFVTILILTALALFLTGSRTAIAAYALTLAAWCFMDGIRSRGPRRIASFLVGAGMLAALAGSLAYVPTGSNLLSLPWALRNSVWTVTLNGATLSSTDNISPQGTRNVYVLEIPRLKPLEDRTDALPALVQGVATSDSALTYISSIYVRGDKEQALRIGTNLGDAPCVVSAVWSRCESPPTRGNGRTRVQFQLLTEPTNHEPLKVELWWPQLEIGNQASPVNSDYLSRIANIFNHFVRRRLGTANLHQDPNLGARNLAFQTAWHSFTQHPIAGNGKRYLERSFLEGTAPSVEVNHAHNVILEHLATAGILGFVFWILSFAVGIAAAWKGYPLAAACIAITILSLNAFDNTYHYIHLYAPFWLGMGILSRWTASVSGQALDSV